MRVASWNVNSVRQRAGHLVSWLSEHKPDVMLLQETKCENHSFPALEIEDLGYNLALAGQKTFNGVAILSKHPLEDVVTCLPGWEKRQESRYIEAVVTSGSRAVRVASVYVPNGQEPGSGKFAEKLEFLRLFGERVKRLAGYGEIQVFGGDYNVAPEPDDVFDPKGLSGTICFHPDERRAFRGLINLGLTDAFRAFHPHERKFSWWDYRGGAWAYGKGMRIDHILLSPLAADRLSACDIDQSTRALDSPSDHAIIWCKLEA